MRLRALLPSALLLASAGCSFAPDVATVPNATVAGTHVEVDADRFDTFRVLSVDGVPVLPVVDQPVRLHGKDAHDLVPAGHPVRLEVEGFAFYDNGAHRLFWDPMHTQGVIEFVPVVGARYALHGHIAPEASSIWLEDEATHERVGATITTPGRGIPGTPTADPLRPEVRGA